MDLPGLFPSQRTKLSALENADFDSSFENDGKSIVRFRIHELSVGSFLSCVRRLSQNGQNHSGYLYLHISACLVVHCQQGMECNKPIG